LELELLGAELQAGADRAERFGVFVRAARVSPEPALRSRVALLLVQQALYLLRRDEAAKKDHPRALGMLEEAVALDPLAADAWYFRGDALARAGFVAFLEAVDAYERALELGTRYLDEARFEQAQLVAVIYGRLLERDRAQALRWMRRAQDLRAELAARDIGLSGLDARLVACFEEDVARGQKAVTAERWDEGLAAFDLAAIADPLNAWVASYRGLCLGELGRSEEMRAAFRDAMDIAVARRQDVWLPFAELAEEARAAGRYDEARAFAARYLEAFPQGERAAWFRERYS
jgi:tetratricopeptide (TPR) repeat protein